MKGSLVIISFFIIGIAAGLSGLIPSGISEGNLTFPLCPAFLRGCGSGKRQQFHIQVQDAGPADVSASGRHASRHIGRSTCRCSPAAWPECNRLSGSRFRLRILFIVQHFHYRIQGSGTRYHRIALEHCPGNVHIAPVAAAGKSGRAIGSDRRRRSDFDGHDIAYHHGLIRQAICCGFAVPRLCARVFNTFHRHLLVHPVEGSEA